MGSSHCGITINDVWLVAWRDPCELNFHPLHKCLAERTLAAKMTAHLGL